MILGACAAETAGSSISTLRETRSIAGRADDLVAVPSAARKDLCPRFAFFEGEV